MNDSDKKKTKNRVDHSLQWNKSVSSEVYDDELQSERKHEKLLLKKKQPYDFNVDI